AKVACILKISGAPNHVGERSSLLGQDALDRHDGALGFLLDGAGDHVAAGVLGDLTGYKDEIAGADRRMKRQVRIPLAYRIDIVALRFRAGVIHRCNPHASTLVSMISTPDTRSAR